MKFWEAMKALDEGKKVRQEAWVDKDLYIKKDFDGSIRDGAGIPYGSWIYVADDWEIYEEPYVTALLDRIEELEKAAGALYGDLVAADEELTHFNSWFAFKDALTRKSAPFK